MNKIFLIILFAFFLFLPSGVFAASPSPTTSAPQLDELKDRIATRVAQLKLVEKRGIIGTVTEVSNMQLTLSDINGNVRFVDVDELTKFTNGKENYGISDITKDTVLSVIGLYNKQSRRLLARSISTTQIPKILHGGISTLDSKNFSFVLTDEKKSNNIDVETITRTMSYTATTGLVRSGFSKLKIGQNIIVIGLPKKDEPDNILASKIIFFTDIPVNPKIKILEIPSTTIVPSTGSAGKLVPILKQ